EGVLLEGPRREVLAPSLGDLRARLSGLRDPGREPPAENRRAQIRALVPDAGALRDRVGHHRLRARRSRRGAALRQDARRLPTASWTSTRSDGIFATSSPCTPTKGHTTSTPSSSAST